MPRFLVKAERTFFGHTTIDANSEAAALAIANGAVDEELTLGTPVPIYEWDPCLASAMIKPFESERLPGPLASSHNHASRPERSCFSPQ
jgi:hypothetical protein